MKVSGFSFVRNAVKYDYPVVESYKSVLPVVDEFVVAVGDSDDGTLDLISSIDSPKIKIIETRWDDSLREGGRVLAVETDKAFNAVAEDSDWAFYIQADEVMHEKYHDTVIKEMHDNLDDDKIHGLLFKYLHFYGSYDYVGDSRRWYRREIRVIRNRPGIQSYKDAQGFRFTDNTKLNVRLIDAFIYHYGWVKDPRAQQRKAEEFHKFWHDDDWVEKNIPKADEFDYSGIDSLTLFEGTHPAVMQQRIAEKNWQFDHDISHRRLELKDKILMGIENLTGWRPGEYRNYRLKK